MNHKIRKFLILSICMLFCFSIEKASAASGLMCMDFFVSKKSTTTIKTEQDSLKVKKLFNGRIFDNLDFYMQLSKNPQLVRKLLVSWYGSQFTHVWLPKLKFKDFDYSTLLLDPGIADRVGEFINFSKKYTEDHPNVSIYQLRKAFANYLGKITLYRSMILTPEQAAYLAKYGIDSAGLFSKTEFPDKWLKTGYGPIKDIISRITQDNETASLAISAPESPEVAISAASYRLNSSITNEFIYIFKIETDEINIVRENQRLTTIPYFSKLAKIFQDTQLIIKSPNDEYFNASWMSGSTEVFFLNHIPAQDILSVEKLPDQRPWEIINFGSANDTINVDKYSVIPRQYQVIENPRSFVQYQQGWNHLRH